MGGTGCGGACVRAAAAGRPTSGARTRHRPARRPRSPVGRRRRSADPGRSAAGRPGRSSAFAQRRLAAGVGARTRSSLGGLPPPALFRHDGMEGGVAGAAISRSRSGRAASSSQSSAWRSSAADGAGRRRRDRARRRPPRTPGRTARRAARRASPCAITSSPSLSSSSRARWRATQSHWRQRCEQNSRVRPGPLRSGSARRHHRHRRSSVMTIFEHAPASAAWLSTCCPRLTPRRPRTRGASLPLERR